MFAAPVHFGRGRVAARRRWLPSNRLASLRKHRQNQKLLDLPNLKLVNGDAFAFWRRPSRSSMSSFSTHPFAQGLVARLAPLVLRVAAPDALIYCEFAKNSLAVNCPASAAAVMIAPAWCTYHLFTPLHAGPQSPQ